MPARSYSPNGLIEPNPDYEMCFGNYHATTAAKIFSLVYFVLCLVISGTNFLFYGSDKKWISLFCVLFTVYSVAVIYGVFLEKRLFLLPFLLIQAILVACLLVVTVVFLIAGTFSDFVRNHHIESLPLRDLYKMHDLNPDDETTQTLVASSVLFFLLFLVFFTAYSWYCMYRAYCCYRDNDRTLCPSYQKGTIVANNDEDEEPEQHIP